MRYFKYPNTGRNLKNALRGQYAALKNEEKAIFRKERIWRMISTAVMLTILFSCLLAGALLISSITPPEAWYWKISVIPLKVVLGFVLFIVSALLSVSLSAPLDKKAASFHVPKMKKELFSKACGHLRDYYGLCDPYIITKCHAASDRKFQNHDVCVFVSGDELRITTDIVHGFLHGERDLGCYAFHREDIVLAKQKKGDQLILELRAGDTLFLLGYRAKGFIERTFLNSSAQ